MSTTGTSFICSFVLKLLLFLKVFTFFFYVLKSLGSAIPGWMADVLQVRSSGCTQPISVGSQSSRPGVNWKRVRCDGILLLNRFISVDYVTDDAILERSVPI